MIGFWETLKTTHANAYIHTYTQREREDRALTKCTVRGTSEGNTMVLLKYTMVLEHVSLYLHDTSWCLQEYGVHNTMVHNQNTMVLSCQKYYGNTMVR